MKTNNIFLGIILFIVLFLPIYQIYKYGLIGYLNKRSEKRKQRRQQLFNLFQ